MNPILRKLSAAVFLTISTIAALAAVPSEALAQGKPGLVKMPPNYRALVARYMLTQTDYDRATLNTAKISKPFNQPGGFFGGDPIPTVCVSIYTKNMLGMAFTGHILFTVRNGQAVRQKSESAILADQTCGPFSPFTEVMNK